MNTNLWPLLGVLVITVAFVIRLHPMLAVIAAALATGIAAKLPIAQVLALIGNGFLKTRNLSLVILLPLAVIGLMERHGIRERAQEFILNIKSVTISKLLITYLLFRQLTASVGLTSLGGQPQMVRPLLSPMVEGIAHAKYENLNSQAIDKLRAYCAATDNIGLFFGEDIFVAFGAVALIANFLHDAGINIALFDIAIWGMPTAICAFLVQAWRIYQLEKSLK